jgi:hypothetical protein
MSEKIPDFEHRKPVQSLYSETSVQRDTQVKKDAGMSLRQIAKLYGKPITHADIERILVGVFPIGAAKRLALHVAPVCAKCEQPLPKPKRVVPAWLEEAVANLQRLEAGAQPKADGYRVYARGGKRVRGARPYTARAEKV